MYQMGVSFYEDPAPRNMALLFHPEGLRWRDLLSSQSLLLKQRGIMWQECNGE